MQTQTFLCYSINLPPACGCEGAFDGLGGQSEIFQFDVGRIGIGLGAVVIYVVVLSRLDDVIKLLGMNVVRVRRCNFRFAVLK